MRVRTSAELLLVASLLFLVPLFARAESFDVDEVIDETASMVESASPSWWVNSGGRFQMSGGLGATLQGMLPANDRWRLAYAASSAVDTENGYRPQNLFRFVNRGTWTDFEQQVRFRITATNRTDSPNRAGHNGILFFSRYLGGDDLYYAGIRVDGLAVVKKKVGGVYTTLGSTRVYPGAYDRSAAPNLLPEGRWIGLRSVTKTNLDGSVTIRIEIEDAGLGAGWIPVLEATDGAGSILAGGFAGIRTDFMDVEFDDYSSVALTDEGPAPTPTSTPTRTATPTSPVPTATPTAPAACTVTLSPLQADLSSAKQNASFAVVAPAGCAWTAKSDAAWLTLRPAASGKGTGIVGYSAARNLAGARQGTITVQGVRFTVQQGAK